MADAYIRFEREGLEGVVAVGTRLLDAMKRFGIRSAQTCELQSAKHCCTVSIIQGNGLFDAPSDIEKEHLRADGRIGNRRLACFATIAAPGEITIMTDETKKGTTKGKEQPKLVQEFETLPLEQKIANLVKMEAVTLGETLSFVINSPFSVFEKVGDVMAEFGMKLEREAKKATRPSTNDVSDPEQKARSTRTSKKAGATKASKPPSS